ncbi:cell death regulator Aven-like isoform 1-T1 [Megaptera novaeangliae]
MGEKLELRLESSVGAEPAVYPWPLPVYVEDDSDAETYGEENEEQGNYSKRKIVSNWDQYQDTEKEVDDESGESQRGTDFSVLLSSAGYNFFPTQN